MKIKSLQCDIRILKLKEPYAIFYESVESCHGVFLSMQTEQGMKGLGFAAPDQAVTGETAEEVHGCFTSVIEPFLKGSDVLQYAWIMESLKDSLPDNPSARAMVDMALYDLLAQKAGVPLYQLLGVIARRLRPA